MPKKNPFTGREIDDNVYDMIVSNNHTFDRKVTDINAMLHDMGYVDYDTGLSTNSDEQEWDNYMTTYRNNINADMKYVRDAKIYDSIPVKEKAEYDEAQKALADFNEQHPRPKVDPEKLSEIEARMVSPKIGKPLKVYGHMESFFNSSKYAEEMTEGKCTVTEAVNKFLSDEKMIADFKEYSIDQVDQLRVGEVKGYDPKLAQEYLTYLNQVALEVGPDDKVSQTFKDRAKLRQDVYDKNKAYSKALVEKDVTRKEADKYFERNPFGKDGPDERRLAKAKENVAMADRLEQLRNEAQASFKFPSQSDLRNDFDGGRLFDSYNMVKAKMESHWRLTRWLAKKFPDTFKETAKDIREEETFRQALKKAGYSEESINTATYIPPQGGVENDDQPQVGNNDVPVNNQQIGNDNALQNRINQKFKETGGDVDNTRVEEKHTEVEMNLDQ